MSELAYLSILDCAQRLRAKEVSSVELVTSLVNRIRQYDPALNAFIEVCVERALAQARLRDDEGARGKWRGPLHGIPYGLKDIFDVAGLPTTCHSKVLLGNIASRNSTVVRLLDDAGAVLLGKTALHEFATGGPSFDLPWPPARNPWNRKLHPGGSSSGSGAAVAAGLVPFALGTDTAGSIRHPATACGVVGIKPTYGTISTDGLFPLSFSLDHVGVLTRSVHENAVSLSVILEPEAAKRMRCEPSHEPFTDMRAGIKNLRIGIVEDFHHAPDVDAEITAATDAAVETLRSQGAQLRRLKLSSLDMYADCGRAIQQSESFAVHAEWLRTRHQDYGKRGRHKLLAGAMIDAERYVKAQQIRTVLIRQFHEAMKDVDVAVCASSLQLPCAIDDEALLERSYSRQARTPFNVTGAPAIALPIAISKAGLPIGLQIFGRHYGEGAIYRTAYFLEQVLALPLRPRLESALSSDPSIGGRT